LLRLLFLCLSLIPYFLLYDSSEILGLELDELDEWQRLLLFYLSEDSGDYFFYLFFLAPSEETSGSLSSFLLAAIGRFMGLLFLLEFFSQESEEELYSSRRPLPLADFLELEPDDLEFDSLDSEDPELEDELLDFFFFFSPPLLDIFFVSLFCLC